MFVYTYFLKMLHIVAIVEYAFALLPNISISRLKQNKKLIIPFYLTIIAFRKQFEIWTPLKHYRLCPHLILRNWYGSRNSVANFVCYFSYTEHDFGLKQTNERNKNLSAIFVMISNQYGFYMKQICKGVSNLLNQFVKPSSLHFILGLYPTV